MRTDSDEGQVYKDKRVKKNASSVCVIWLQEGLRCSGRDDETGVLIDSNSNQEIKSILWQKNTFNLTITYQRQVHRVEFKG